MGRPWYSLHKARVKHFFCDKKGPQSFHWKNLGPFLVRIGVRLGFCGLLFPLQGAELAVLVEQAFHHEGKGAVAGHVTGCAKAVLQGKDGDEECDTIGVKAEHACHDTKGGDNSAAGNTWSAHCKDCQKQSYSGNSSSERKDIEC